MFKVNIRGKTDQLAEEVKRVIKRFGSMDISGYKNDFLMRRVRARMLALGITDYKEYLQRLKHDPQEVDKLLNELSINVSEFFRDPWVWEKISSILKDLINRKTIVRIWSAGCSRGEEPYTIAILAKEVISGISGFKKVTIYATDIDADAIRRAQEGIYGESSLKNVPKYLLYKYFDKINIGKYRIKDSVKELVKFRRHDLIKDPPLMLMDMVFCRNVLIYFNKELQKNVVMNLYKSLNTNGFLVLGISEYLPENVRSMFRVYDQHARIFQKIG
ncbi:MAG: protein-glutamate O-methyltransferase CheR [Staphylothermus sp.]|nr:protein-glutamate O-methyltransferase CheR [Staphylothermus sp.]